MKKIVLILSIISFSLHGMDGDYPVIQAVEMGNISQLFDVLNQGESVNERRIVTTPLMAAFNGYIESAKDNNDRMMNVYLQIIQFLKGHEPYHQPVAMIRDADITDDNKQKVLSIFQ